MKSIYRLYKIAFVIPALLLFACNDDIEPLSDYETPSQLTLTLSVPEPQTVNIDSRGDVQNITSVTVFCFNELGEFSSRQSLLEQSTVTSGIEVNGNTINVTVPIHRLSKSIHIATNISGVTGNDPAEMTTDDASAGVMWGRADVKDLISGSATISMIRQTAKVSVTKSASASSFTLSTFGVERTATKGSIAPALWNLNPTAPTTAPGANYTASSGEYDASYPVYVFETPSSKASRIIIKGSYQGKTGYYTIAFAKRTGYGASETPGNYNYGVLDIVRNHHYKVHIIGVRAAGWPTYQEALAAEPDNRLTVMITDESPEISNIIADRDYMLGVSDDLTVDYNGNAVISILTSWSGNGSSTLYQLSTDSEWIDVANASETKSETVNNLTGSANASGHKYTVTIPLSINSTSTQERTGTVTVRSGDLTRSINITQKGRDYKRDTQRPVTLEGLPGGTISNYFDFLDNTLQGVKPEDDYQGTIRNEGLHFPAVPAYTLTYKIKKLSGDRSPSVTSGFTYKDNGSEYVITVSSNTAGISTGTFSVINAANATISYPLYKTGYIHQLTDDYAKYQREEIDGEAPATGWFYYGVVKKGSYYILDRNLGASCNHPYISTYAGFKNNRRAIGGYFKIATERTTKADRDNPKTIISNLGLSNFKIPTEEQISAWGITSRNPSSTSGELALVGAFTADQPSCEVYIPHGGYFEATSPKYETHANIWTRTLLSGNQGFDPDLSPEFGYWYRYLDVYGSKCNYSQMRFANGSGGAVPTESSVYKFMPIRLIWQ